MVWRPLAISSSHGLQRGRVVWPYLSDFCILCQMEILEFTPRLFGTRSLEESRQEYMIDRCPLDAYRTITLHFL